MQLDKQIQEDEAISAELETLNATGTKLTKQMIIVPIDNTLLYVEPIYQTMLNESEVRCRMKNAKDAKIPVINYGLAIAQIHGILRRSLQLFPDIVELLESETTLSA